MSATTDQLPKGLTACVRAWDYAAFDQAVDNYGRDRVVRLLFGLIEGDDADLADAAVSKLRRLSLDAEFGALEFLRLLSHSDEQVRTRATGCLCTIDGANARCFICCFHNMLTGGVELYTASAYAVRRTFGGMPWGTSPDGLRSALSVDAISPSGLAGCEDLDAAFETWSQLNEPYRRVMESPGDVRAFLADFDGLSTAERTVRVAAAGWASDGAVETLTKLSYSSCLRTRLVAIINLSQFSMQFDREAFTAIVSHLNDENSLVRREASRVLLESGKNAKEVVGAVIRALSDLDSEVRFNAIQTAGEIGPFANRAIPRLIDFLSEDNEGCRIAAVKALGKIGNAALPAVLPLLRLLRQRRPGLLSDLGMRSAFGGILYDNNSNEMKKIVIGLGEALNHADPEVRSVAAYALSLVGKCAVPLLPQITLGLSDESEEVRFWLRSLLEELAPPPMEDEAGT
jgi:HEAT repeat protein